MQDKLSAMADKSRQKIEADKKQKMDAWVHVKNNAPDIADFLVDMGKAFGKLAAVTVTMANGDVKVIR